MITDDSAFMPYVDIPSRVAYHASTLLHSNQFRLITPGARG
jgi:hypothetical protein